MKKLKYLLVLLVALILPITVFAEGEDATAESKEVKVYFFRGEGCSHCAEAEAWFESIEAEYGNYFQIIDYETWYNQDNAELMKKVAKARGEEAQGVPYIIIGNKSWNGYTESYSEEMIEQIKSEFEKDVKDRYDIMELLTEDDENKDSGSDVVALIVILAVVGGICFGVYKARNNTK